MLHGYLKKESERSDEANDYGHSWPAVFVFALRAKHEVLCVMATVGDTFEMPDRVPERMKVRQVT